MRRASFAPARRNRRLLVEGMGLGWTVYCHHLRHFPCCALGPKLLKLSVGSSGPNTQSQLRPCSQEQAPAGGRDGVGLEGQLLPPAAFSLLRIRIKTS